MKREINFTVDAKLLRELGERLVGRPHIALGELIKNSYDADARNVEIIFDGSRIIVSDDGHGMTEDTFVKRWMRIGTTNKSDQRYSPALKRPLTGSKGVGRLAVQLLAAELDLRSTPLEEPETIGEPAASVGEWIRAQIDWRQAIQKDQITDVQVDFSTGSKSDRHAANSRHGTTIILSDLAADWGVKQFEGLAREIWALQPPFAVQADDGRGFSVKLTTPAKDIQRTFDEQMTAIMEVASATVTGRMLPAGATPPENAPTFVLAVPANATDEDGEIATDADPDEREGGTALDESKGEGDAPSRFALLEVTLKGNEPEAFVVEIENCQLFDFDFEIRIFNLRNRQPSGISVVEARRYFTEFGGVHIYDNGFRLPYYGPDADWLRLELDHARRISRSQLLPSHLQVRDAMQDLPSNTRVFGAASISTSEEARMAAESGRNVTDALSIQITRDRLTDNLAFDQLRRSVRLSLDLYARAQARAKAIRVLDVEQQPRSDPSFAIREAITTVDTLRDELTPTTYQTLRDALDSVSTVVSMRSRQTDAYASLLGSLATAGMTALAHEHEIARQRGEVVAVARQLRSLAGEVPAAQGEALMALSLRLRQWSERADRVRALLRPLLDEETRTVKDTYRAKKLVADVVESMRVLARGTAVDIGGISNDLMLPTGTYTAWFAVLQNLLVNSYRATLESKPPLVQIDGGSKGNRGWIRLLDNGAGGVDLATAHRLFLPFERQGKVSERAEILGLGGSGLGLTIVKMIADEIGFSVKFVEPDDGWSTAVRIDWRVKA